MITGVAVVARQVKNPNAAVWVPVEVGFDHQPGTVISRIQFSLPQECLYGTGAVIKKKKNSDDLLWGLLSEMALYLLKSKMLSDREESKIQI